MKAAGHNFDILDKSSWVKTDYGLYYAKEKIKFIKLSNRESLKDVVRVIDAFLPDGRVGVMCSFLKESDLAILREKRISYLINDREIKIFGKEERQIFKSERDNIFLGDVTPTLLASPTGLEIVDTILKLSNDELKNDTPTKLCKDFGLSRPKLSNIMNAFRASNLIELKRELLDIEISWWLEAFNTPITKRKMTPFQTKKTRRYALKEHLDDSQFKELIQKLKNEDMEVEFGGLSYLKNLGSIRMQEYDMVVRVYQIIDIVEKMKLRPAKKNELAKNIFITPIDGDLKEQRFYSKIKNYHNRFSDLENLNPLRFLWGINYKESRVQEERKSLLESYFNEIKKNNH